MQHTFKMYSGLKQNTKATVTLEDKNDLLQVCIKHIVIYSVAEEIYSFRKGQASFGVKQMLCKSQSDGMKKLMYLCGRVHFLPCFSTPGFELHKLSDVLQFGKV